MWTSFRNIIFFFYCYDHATIQISRHLYNIRNCIFALERLKDKTFTMEEICHRCAIDADVNDNDNKDYFKEQNGNAYHNSPLSFLPPSHFIKGDS